MIPTSLAVAGFTPVAGTSSSESSFTSFAYSGTNEAADQATSFRQVMSSYTQSNRDSETEENRSNSRSQATSEQTARSRDDDQASDAAAAAAEQPESSATPASSLSGHFGLRHNDEREEEDAADNTSAAAGENGTPSSASATPQTSAATQAAGLSTLQMLLKGASLTQIITGVNTASANAVSGNAGDGTSAALAAAAANGQLGGDTLKLVIAKSLTAGTTGAASTKDGKAKADDSKRASEGAATSDLTSMATSILPAAQLASEAEASGGEAAAHDSKAGLAIGGASAEALHLSAAGQTENAANPAANNLAFAVRLTGDRTAHTEADETGTQTPLTLTGTAQSALVAAAAEAAASGGGAETGEHSGERPEQGAFAFAAETAAGSQADNSKAAAAAEPATPLAASDPEAATATDPVRNIRLQLAGENNQRVDIRLVDIGGEMRVSVRAGDTKLAQTLQEHLPDLSKTLNQQSVRAEIWSPRTENPSQTSGSNAGGQSGRGDTPGQGGQQQRQGNGRQQQNQPDWVDEFENYSSRTTTTRSNQVWPQ